MDFRISFAGSDADCEGGDLMASIKIDAKNGPGTKVYIDGHELRPIRAMVISQSVDDGCRLIAKFEMPVDELVIESEDADICIKKRLKYDA